MKKTGSLLKDKRESANLSLSEVALATKINPKILLAIENGDEAHLPAKTFLKGFIKSYALFLKMDVEEVLRSYQEETGGPTVERVHEAYKTGPTGTNGTPASRRRVEDENSSGMRTAAVVVIVLLIGLIIGVRELIEKYQREKVTTSTEAQKVSPLTQAPAVGEEGKAPEAPTLTNNAAVAPAVAEPAPAAAVAPPPAPPPGPAQTPAPAVKAEETAPKIEPEPAPPKEPKVNKEPVAAEPKPVKKEVASASAAETKPVTRNEIILEALDNVDIKMQIKGETKRLSLAPTQVHTIHSSDPVVLDFSDGGAVSIILNGHERGPVGELGKPKQITVP